MTGPRLFLVLVAAALAVWALALIIAVLVLVDGGTLAHVLRGLLTPQSAP